MRQSFFFIIGNILSYFTSMLTELLLCTVKKNPKDKNQTKKKPNPNPYGDFYSFAKKKNWQANSFETMLVKTVENT